MTTFDVIVVGGGVSGGLPAATYLQKAGLDDPSREIAAEKPFMQFRHPSVAIFPTVTAGAPAETPTPTPRTP